jgi:hypothetical protein
MHKDILRDWLLIVCGMINIMKNSHTTLQGIQSVNQLHAELLQRHRISSATYGFPWATVSNNINNVE